MSKRNVSYVKPPDPSFLQKIKERVGYQEGPTIETKKQQLPVVDDNDDCEDEKPVVVVLKPGDLTEEQANALKEELDKDDETEKVTSKIIFRKSSKRQKDNPLITSSKKCKINENKHSTLTNPKQGIKNTSLLSFDEDEG